MRTLAALALLALTALALAGCSDGGGQDGGAEPQDAAKLSPEAGVVSGRLTAAAASAQHTIDLKTVGHERMAFSLVLLTNAGTNRIELNTTSPGGTHAPEVDSSPFLYAFPGSNPVVSFGQPVPGTWTAEVRLSAGALADYEVHWCADSQESPGPAANKACHRVY